MEGSCIFCDRKNFEKSLIREFKDYYLTATLGQITDGYYLLLIPKRHVRCLGEMNYSEIDDVWGISYYVQKCMKFGYSCDVTLFEHGIVGQSIQHAHLHILPANIDFTNKICSDYPTSETNALIALRDLPRAYNIKKEPYLFWQSPGKAPMVCWNPPAPTQYLRILAAQALGRPERANWRKMDPELDKKLIDETIEHLQHYF